MTRFVTSFHRLVTALSVVALIAPMSAGAESRPPAATDMRRLAAELQAAIDRAHARNRQQPSPGETGQPHAAPLPSPGLSARDVLEEMNAVRRRHGLRPLQMNGALALAAGDRVEDMFTRRYFDHVAPDGTPPFASVARRGYRYSTIGENLAAGQRSAQQVVADWMLSPGHRANILGTAFEDCGIAIAAGSPIGSSRGYTFVAFYGSEARPRPS